ncbi:c-type cytochrome [Uliginosibacterium sediminicola]|uniref:C-type cytochrome n=1 Tax=Uliginosibacterium sediminicola TaxID=2024550 RepID=A0ABU9YY82_9RHOO
MKRSARLVLSAALTLMLATLLACSKKEPVPAEETAKLIAPVAQISVAAPVAAADGPVDGKKVYETVCSACHATGAAGAPKAGDKAAWGPRIAQGKEALYTSALGGKNAMPAKGGNPALSDDEVKAAVDHLISLAK